MKVIIGATWFILGMSMYLGLSKAFTSEHAVAYMFGLIFTIIAALWIRIEENKRN